MDEFIERNKHDDVLLKAAKSMLEDRVNYIEILLTIEDEAKKINDPDLKQKFINKMNAKLQKFESMLDCRTSIAIFKTIEGLV